MQPRLDEVKCRLEDEMIAAFVAEVRKSDSNSNINSNLVLPVGYEEMSDQELAVWNNDNVIYPDKVRLNCYYYRHYSFWKDIEMIFATVQGRKVRFAGEEI